MRSYLIIFLWLSYLPFTLAEEDLHDNDNDRHRRQLAPTFSKCGWTSAIRHDTWYKQLFTNSPVLFPTNDEELCSIVRTAKTNDCRVRVRGAGHSEDGLVMQKLDELKEDVVVVHLKDYIPTDIADDGSTGSDWNGVLVENTNSVKVPTGWSTLHLMAEIRPQGYLTRTNTAGRIFSVGGAYLNPSVHGNIINESRYAAQVRSVRTMDADCNIRVFSGEQVKDWRGSAGLLGIVTAVEIDVVKDTGLSMTRSSLSTASYDREIVRAWISDEYSNHDGVEFFYWLYEDVIDSYQVDYNGGEPIDPVLARAFYDRELGRNPDVSYEGGNPSGVAEFAQLTAGLIESNVNLARLTSLVARKVQTDMFDTQAKLPRDGYYLEPDQVPNIHLVSSSIPCASDCVDETTEIFEMSRNFLLEIKNEPSSTWYPNMPLEWRVFTVQPDEMTLEHLSPGKYVSFEQMALRVGNDGLAASRYFMALQEQWLERFPGAAIHHGKGYGYQNLPEYGNEGDAVQYQNDNVLDSVYTFQVRKTFQEKMLQFDPEGTFAAGSFLRLLGMTGDKFTPKQYIGGSCFEFGDGDCISGCCDQVFFSTMNNVCLATGKDVDERCSETCECLSGLECKWGRWPSQWTNRCRR